MARVKNDPPSTSEAGREGLGIAPFTLEGFSLLHQMFRLKRGAWKMLEEGRRRRVAAQAAELLTGAEQSEAGPSALFWQLGHKGDLLFLHFRRSADELALAENEVADLGLAEFLEPATSYLSVIEVGLYDSTLKLYSRLRRDGIGPDSSGWREAAEQMLDEQRQQLKERLWPPMPARRYLCFYPMNKKRSGQDNWYSLPLEERRRLMHEHGMVGRRYAGKVTQIISGSIGLDDWEWGVDLFADDPLVFKKLVYEMRFDESSARYAEFGPFYFGIRLKPSELGKALAVKGD
jgi:hydrogen peroxide-dependent heme synthase